MTTSPLQFVHPVSRIFISHSSKDQAFGRKLVQDLRQALGNDDAVWYDSAGSSRGGGLVPGDSWWSVIKRELAARNFFLVILSPDAVTSPWVEKEINMALIQQNRQKEEVQAEQQENRQKRIIPLLYRQCTLPLDIADIHYIDFSNADDYPDAFHQLIDVLGLPIGMDASGTPVEAIASEFDRLRATSVSEMHNAFRQKRWDEVLQEADTLIREIPGAFSSDVYSMQGQAYLRLGQLQRAEEALQAAFALIDDTKQQFDLLLKYSAISYEQKRWDRIHDYANRIVDLLSQNTLPFAMALEVLSQMRLASLDDEVQAEPKRYLTYTGHKGSVRSLAWWIPPDSIQWPSDPNEKDSPDPNKKYLASSGTDCTVQIWECRKPNGHLLQTCQHKEKVRCVAWSPNGRQIATACDDGNVYIWQAFTGILVTTFKKHKKSVRSVAWSHKGDMIASGGRDGTVCLWDVEQRKLDYVFKGHTDWVNAVAWSRDDSLVASASSDKTVRIWDISAKECRLAYAEHHEEVNTLIWSRTGNIIASAGNDNEVHLWESATRALRFKYKRHDGPIIALARSPHGRRLASASQEIRVWYAATGDDLLTHSDQGWIRSVAWSDDGTMIAVAGDDGRVRIWEIGNEL